MVSQADIVFAIQSIKNSPKMAKKAQTQRSGPSEAQELQISLCRRAS